MELLDSFAKKRNDPQELEVYVEFIFAEVYGEGHA